MDIQKLMQQAQEMQARMGEIQTRLENAEIEGRAGGGLVSVTLNGKRHLKKVALDASLLKPEEKEVLEDLIVAAFNDATTKIEEKQAGAMQEAMSGMQLPPGFKLPF